MIATGLPPFPAARRPPPPLLDVPGLALRPATLADIAFLMRLYAGFRAAEMLMVPWPAEQKRAFLADQFGLQHRHFTRHHPAADFWLVIREEAPGMAEPIGRLYLERRLPVWRIVDIGLLPDARGQGLGGALLDWVQRSAIAAGARGVALNVSVQNPRARALYLRIGFIDHGDEQAMHQPMLWRTPEAASRG